MPHEQVELRQRFGQQWQGFSEDTVRAWLEAAGFTSVRYVPLPAEPTARGPMLFAASGVRAWMWICDAPSSTEVTLRPRDPAALRDPHSQRARVRLDPGHAYVGMPDETT